MKLIHTQLNGLLIIVSTVFEDSRGRFIKTFHHSSFKNLGLRTDFKERYYSVSKKNVIRGMHFQTPPKDHTKLVNVVKGSILDIVLDIRLHSETYGEFVNIKLGDSSGKLLYIPAGFAHGFKSLENNTIVEYMQTNEHSKENDCGIHYNSFGYNWNVDNPIITERDHSFESFTTYKSPFL